MNCYECAKDSQQQPAVVTCSNCGAGMCMNHLEEERTRVGPDRIGPGGTQIGCGHDTWTSAPESKPLKLS
jgi:hypothetical protein